MTADLSTVILTFNEEANLPACLASVAPLGGELFVVDSGSRDRTTEIARAAGAQVFEHPFENYGEQRNWALRNLPIKTGWVLNLDADERLTPELAEEIGKAVSTAPDSVSGYMLRQRTVFMGRWIRHGGHYPSYHLRLFRFGRGRCERRLYDQHFLVDGPVLPLENDYLDVVASDIDNWTLRHLRWARLEAEDIHGRVGNGEERVKPSPVGSPIQRKRWLRDGPYARTPLYLRAFLYWGYRYFLRLGFLDGREGLVFHFLQGFWFRFMVDVRLDELRTGFSPRRARETTE